MSDVQQQPYHFSRARPAAALTLDASARWLPEEDDAALGCECANPALQIEHWHRDVAPAQASRV